MVYGEGAWIRNPLAGGIGTFRGVQLYRAGPTFTMTDGDPFAVPFDTADVDTDSIKGTGSTSILGLTIPDGAWGLVPAGMAGWWKLSGQINCLWTSDLAPILPSYAIMINDETGPNVIALFSEGGTFPLNIAPILVQLAEGDVVWWFMAPHREGQLMGGDGGATHLRMAWMLMEYIGPPL